MNSEINKMSNNQTQLNLDLVETCKLCKANVNASKVNNLDIIGGLLKYSGEYFNKIVSYNEEGKSYDYQKALEHLKDCRNCMENLYKKNKS